MIRPSTLKSSQYIKTKNHKSDVARLQKFEEAIMAADGKSNLAVIHNNLIEYEENAHKSSEKLDEVRSFSSLFFIYDFSQGT